MQFHEYWQSISPRSDIAAGGPFSAYYPAPLDDGNELRLPIRALPDGEHALGSLGALRASIRRSSSACRPSGSPWPMPLPESWGIHGSSPAARRENSGTRTGSASRSLQ
jgi:hypothetical protein